MLQDLSVMLDAVNPVADMSAYGEQMQQVMPVSIKEMFEITCIAGLVFLLFILCSTSTRLSVAGCERGCPQDSLR